MNDQVKMSVCLLLLLVLVSCSPAASPGAAETAGAVPAGPLMDPSAEAMKEKAPDVFNVAFSTSKGDFNIQVTRSWAPIGADRFYNLVRNGFYDEARFFRVIRSPRPFMVQFGIHADPMVSARWTDANIPDDAVTQSNTRGTISFATAGPNTRTTQVFINYDDENSRLDASGFAPFGKVTSGMDIIDQLYSAYGEGAPDGNGPAQDRLEQEGNGYLKKDFPLLDYIKSAKITP